MDKALDEVRPYLIADGGNVEVAAVQDGVVMLRLQGACGTCPSSTATMKMGIERSLRVSHNSYKLTWVLVSSLRLSLNTWVQANSTLGRLSWAVILLQGVSVGFSTCLANVAVRVAKFCSGEKR